MRVMQRRARSSPSSRIHSFCSLLSSFLSFPSTPSSNPSVSSLPGESIRKIKGKSIPGPERRKFFLSTSSTSSSSSPLLLKRSFDKAAMHADGLYGRNGLNKNGNNGPGAR